MRTERRRPAGRLEGVSPAIMGDASATRRRDACETAGWKPAFLLLLFACSPSAVTPIEIDRNADTCHYCRMTISNPKFAVQVLDPGEEPRLFDDIGCAVNELRGQRAPEGRTIFVADWKTGAWMPNDSAVFERCTHAETPMASHLVAMKSPSADPRCTPVTWKEILR